MKIISERRFDFLPKKMWEHLSKEDRDNLRQYRGTYGHYKRNDDKITELQKELKKRKEKKKGYVSKLTKLNFDLDHLRNDFHFSWSVSKLKHRPNYYNFTISRKGSGRNNKTGSFGSVKVITEHLNLFYKGKKKKLEELKKRGWKTFVGKEVSDPKGRIYNLLLECMMKDVSLKSFTINRDFLFPLPESSKGVSIPLMMTNKMRQDLTRLGYTRDEIKEMNPQEGWDNIKKGDK
jgi:hypothetical protein